LGNYLGQGPIHNKTMSRSGIKVRGIVRHGRALSEARFTGDNFLGNVVDHGPGALFSHQA
jgi:hypothetical protein